MTSVLKSLVNQVFHLAAVVMNLDKFASISLSFSIATSELALTEVTIRDEFST